MYDLNELLFHYERLITLLDEDITGLNHALSGEIPETYQQFVKEEISAIRQAERVLKQML